MTCGSVVPASARIAASCSVVGAGEQPHGGEAALHRRADLGILLGRQRLFEQRGGVGRGMLQRVLRRGEPRRRGRG